MKTALSSYGRVLSYLFYLALVYFLMCMWRPARAQSPVAVSVGDPVPDASISGLINAGKTTVKLSEFKGKLLIVDFWATWCAPCVMMMPRIDSLQKQFEGKVYFLSTTAEPEAKVNAFLEKYALRKGKRINLPTVTGDVVLDKMFPHNSIPHYVWIDQQGIVRAVTGLSEITGPKIAAFLEKRSVAFTQAKVEKKTAYTEGKPLLADGNGGDGSNLVYHSLLTKYTPGLILGHSWKIDTAAGTRITLTNADKYWLYNVAYAKPGGWFNEENVRVESRDSARITSSLFGQPYLDWLADGNGFCYEIIVPAALARKTNELMQQQLRDFFPELTAKVVSEKRQCLALVQQKENLSISSAGGKPVLEVSRMGWKARNVSLGRVAERLSQMQVLKLPVVNQTSYRGAVDLDIDAGFLNLEGLNKQLEAYGLALVEKTVEQPVLIIGDNPDYTR